MIDTFSRFSLTRKRRSGAERFGRMWSKSQKDPASFPMGGDSDDSGCAESANNSYWPKVVVHLAAPHLVAAMSRQHSEMCPAVFSPSLVATFLDRRSQLSLAIGGAEW